VTLSSKLHESSTIGFCNITVAYGSTAKAMASTRVDRMDGIGQDVLVRPVSSTCVDDLFALEFVVPAMPDVISGLPAWGRIGKKIMAQSA
jgi:hypothetical protein